MIHETLTAVFGWMTVLNFGLLALAGLGLSALRGMASGLHSRMFGLDEAEVNRVYFRWLANYKLLTLVLCLVPYLALRLV